MHKFQLIYNAIKEQNSEVLNAREPQELEVRSIL